MRQLRCNSLLTFVVPLIASLMLVVPAVRAQVRGQVLEKLYDAFAVRNVGALSGLSEHRSQPIGRNTGRDTMPHLQMAEHGTGPLVGTSPLFLSAVAYDVGGINCSGQGSPFTWVAVGDVNGDGKPDIVATSCGSDTVSVLLGNGDGTFQSPATYDSGGQRPQAVAIADVNGDGKPDLVVGLLSGGIGVLLGNGDDTFQSPVIYDSGGPGAYLAIADVNRDGRPDLVVATCSTDGCFDQGGKVAVLLGNGDGTFKAPVFYDVGIPTSVAVADVNSDGIPDVVVANWENPGTVAVLLGRGNGTFKTAVTYDPGGIEATSIAIADVNGDNKPDLLVANWCDSAINCPDVDGSVGVLLGNGDGTFQTAVAYDSGGHQASAVAVADVNGDGKPDVVIANWGGESWDDLGVLLANGDGTFQSALRYGSGAVMPAPVVMVDVNGDGWPDLVVGNLQSNFGVGVLLNNSGPHSPTTTALVSSLNPAPLQTPVTYTATLIGQRGVLTGSVTFQDGGSTLGTVPLANDQAAYATTYKRVGYHNITATYSGDVHNLSSTSSTLVEHVIGFASKTILTTSGSPSLVGQPITFTATVTSTHGVIPDGELVTFYDGTAIMASIALAGGRASYTTSSLSAKTHTVKATYAGDTTFEPSTSAVKQVVVKYATRTSLTLTPSPSTYGQPVTFTATVTPSGPYAVTGQVRFFDGTLGIGTATLNGGLATLTKTSLAVGTHAITAEYLSNSYNAKSISPVVNQVVQ